MSEMYDLASAEYAMQGVDTEAALTMLKAIPISVHCWQGDDVQGFDTAGALSGGIQATGNYPGRARNFEELKQDIAFACSLMPGVKRLNLHASYAVKPAGDTSDRDEVKAEYFKPWVDFAKKEGLAGIDFNPTLFSHPMVKNGLTLSSPDEKVRAFWIKHCIACLRISEYLATEMGTPCLMNIWIPDGFKDVPADRLGPRMRLKDSLDKILAAGYDKSKVSVAVESKVFGIGIESYTVGSSEFYMNYAAKNGICCLLDNGHYHPTEVVSDKIPSLLAFYDKIALHVTRGVRWDSDHVILFEDEIKEIAKEIVRNDAIGKVMLSIDYFDASINRISAWVTGQRALEEALLFALLQPSKDLKKLQDESRWTELMARQEQCKMMPYGAVWEEYLAREDKPVWYMKPIQDYEKEVLSKRA
ncbi:MAG: L-rhamnose isomerase [Clostridia bacterium]|nr:L-rhamnose isomerase [Clostridia bacterium]